MFIKQQDRIRNNTQLALIFEGAEEYFLFKKAIRNRFGNKISIFFTNGDRVRYSAPYLDIIIDRGVDTLAITDNDPAGVGIRDFLITKGVDAFTISDFFASDATHFEDFIVQEGLYPSWFRRFFSKDLIDEYRDKDGEELTPEELIEFTYKLEKDMIVDTELQHLPLEKIIRNWYEWIRKRIENDESVPKKKNKKIRTKFDVVYSIHQNSHYMLKKVKYELPKLIDVEGTQMFEYFVDEINKRIS